MNNRFGRWNGVSGSELFDQETLGSELMAAGVGTDLENAAWTSLNATVDDAVTITLLADYGSVYISPSHVTVVPGTLYKYSVLATHGTVTAPTTAVYDLDNAVFIAVDVPLNDGTETEVYFIAPAGCTKVRAYAVRASGSTGTMTSTNISIKEVTAPDKSIPSTDPWPALAGSEAITAQNDRDFSSGTIGNWAVNADGAGTCTYDGTNPGGEKVGKLTSSGDTYIFGYITQAHFSVSANTLYRVEAKMRVPAANTRKAVYLLENGFQAAGNTVIDSASLSDDTWTTLSGYMYVAADVVGSIQVGFNGDPADGDILYFDDISIRPVQISWVPQGTNTIEIDEAADALKITYDSHTNGAYLILRDTLDLNSNLVIGASYLLTFDYKVDAGGSVNAKVRFPPNDLVVTGNLNQTSWTSAEMTFVAESTTAMLFTFNNFSAGDVFYMRNLSIKQFVGYKEKFNEKRGWNVGRWNTFYE